MPRERAVFAREKHDICPDEKPSICPTEEAQHLPAGANAHFVPRGSVTFAPRRSAAFAGREGALAANGLALCGGQTDDHKARQAPRSPTENRTLAALGASAHYFFASARHTLVPARAMANVNQKMHITRG